MIYMFGQEHKGMWRHIVPNFFHKALQIYTDMQQRIIVEHLVSWCSSLKGKSIPLKALYCNMNLEFVGPYLDAEARQLFHRDYNYFNVGLMKLPSIFPDHLP